jgi:hypothetical protein
MNFRELEQLGDADLTICGLRLWIHGRQFPDATDYWDGNWLRVTAYCIYPHSAVRIQNDSCVRLDELAALLSGCERMYSTLSGNAELQCMEPYLAVELSASTNGHIGVKLSVTRDHCKETHEYEDEIDQSYLPGIINSCQAILAKFPMRDPK